jgi:hypothetical protein
VRRAVLLGAALAAVVLPGCSRLRDASIPYCPPFRDASILILMAQAVPSAAYVPCISEFPAGWTFGGQRLRNGAPQFWLDSDRAGSRAVTVLLTKSCDVSKAVEVPPDPGRPGIRRYEEPNALPPRFFGNRYYVFPGGCVTYRFAFVGGASFAEAVAATDALSFVSRAEGVRVLRKEGLILCGRGVACPG